MKHSVDPHGAKLGSIVDLLNEIASKKEKAILFVQYGEQLSQAKRALAASGITAVVVTSTAEVSEQINEFQENHKRTVLVLNASDETAAGLNLQFANHVIFFSPLLRDTQYAYDATMAQAVGRVRRPGQEKQIYVHRIVALNSIDVDIMEHREKRTDALTEYGAPEITRPVTSKTDVEGEKAKRERTQLVKEDGWYSLRPQSWLVQGSISDMEAERVKGKNRVTGWENFSSLIKFSRAYTEDDD
jgi:SNF2 family DNA or RNA helicase